MTALKNNLGFNMVQLLIATTIFTVVSLGVMNLIIYYTKMEQQQRLLSGIISARYTLISYLQHERGWGYTITSPENNQPASSDCLTGDTSITGVGSNYDCFGVADTPLVVYNPNGELFYDARPASPSRGFNRDGTVCNSYNSAAGSGDFNCPFRAEVYWRTLCAASPCYHPGVEVEVRFEVNQDEGEKKLSFNPENYNFVFQK